MIKRVWGKEKRLVKVPTVCYTLCWVVSTLAHSVGMSFMSYHEIGIALGKQNWSYLTVF